MPYRIDYAPAARRHMGALAAPERAAVVDQVEKQLVDQPTLETRNRKRLRENPLAQWELRVGKLRVLYDVQQEPEPTVFIRAVGVKVRHRLRIGKEWREL